MKKILVTVLALALIASVFAGCSAPKPAPTAEVTAKPTAEPTEAPKLTEEPAPTEEPSALSSESPVRIGTLAGPTGMGMIQLINDDSGVYDVSIFTAPDQIIPKIIKGEVDIAAVPSNLAAVLNKKTNGVLSVLSVNTLGVLYIVEDGDTVNSISDLSGKTLHATGQGASPEYVLNDVLANNELKDVDIKYIAQHAELANQVAAGEIKLAMLPEPFVSMVLAKNDKLKVKISLDSEWQAIYGEGVSMPMSTTIVRKEYLENNPEAVQEVLEAYKASVEFVNSDSKAAADLMVKHGIIGAAPIAIKAIPRCQITYIDGQEAKDLLLQYYTVLFESNPKSIGGEMPSDDMYFIP